MRKRLLLPAILFALLSLFWVQHVYCTVQPPPADAPPTARNFPWLSVLLGLTVVIGALVYSAKRRNKGT